MPSNAYLTDVLAFRVPEDIGRQIRAEAAATAQPISDVVRGYVVAGVRSATETKTASGPQPRSAVPA